MNVSNLEILNNFKIKVLDKKINLNSMRYFLGRLNKIKEKILLIGYGHGNAFEYSFIRNNEKKMNSLKRRKIVMRRATNMRIISRILK